MTSTTDTPFVVPTSKALATSPEGRSIVEQFRLAGTLQGTDAALARVSDLLLGDRATIGDRFELFAVAISKMRLDSEVAKQTRAVILEIMSMFAEQAGAPEVAAACLEEAKRVLQSPRPRHPTRHAVVRPCRQEPREIVRGGNIRNVPMPEKRRQP